MLERYRDLKSDEWAKITGVQAKLRLSPKATPIFLKARPVPFKLITLLDKELEELSRVGVLTKIENSEWATPIVPILKSNGRIRICGDYKATVNPKLIVDEHPLPTINEIFAKLAGGIKFSKIDLRQAYLQMEVDSKSSEILTLNTHRGLFKVNRLMYGIASAPAIWQRTIENILQGIPGTAVFLDDIVVTGESEALHLQRLDLVLQRLQNRNIRINLEKSKFMMDEIQYCGFTLRKEGILKDRAKVEAIKSMPRPKNVQEVRAFVGMINYYGRFIRNLSAILYPLNQLLHIKVPFIWSKAQEQAFIKAKDAFLSDQILAHYDSKLPLILATDASPYGVGAVLSQLHSDGTEKVLQYASQTLSDTQQKYSQIDKEAFGIIYGIKKFYQYLYGNKFTLITDHKPLIQIFAPNKSLPVYSAMRMQHYAIFLQGFNYTIKYRNSKEHGNADGLSRLPVSESNSNTDVVEAFQIEELQELLLDANLIEKETRKDTKLKKLLCALQTGKEALSEDRFNLSQEKFNLQDGVIMRGFRVVIPPTLRTLALKQLHTGHFGINKMKAIARGYCWWPGLDKDIQSLVENCVACNKVRNNPPKVEQHIWEPAAAAMHRVHADFAGPFLGKWLFVMVDAYSKWPEVRIVKNITAKTIIKECTNIFASYGIPKIWVTDNGRTFISKEFKNFLRSRGVIHKCTAPYNPATNGQAERFIQTLKNGLKRANANESNIAVKLEQFLLQYRAAPHTSTKMSPAELFLGRKVRTKLDLIFPRKEEDRDRINQEIKARELALNKRVACRNYIGRELWKFGRIIEKLGKLHYKIKLDDDRIWKRHINQLRPIGDRSLKSDEDTDYGPIEETLQDNKVQNEEADAELRGETVSQIPLSPNATPQPEHERDKVDLSESVRRSTRKRQPPSRYGNVGSKGSKIL
ncbi:uncharacterized protein K02A2.6-like [Nylanderia fulva]|uniref:uncharacterized protein K02A2.6-like n=1 Tax=Nylanderia fulva TaxID=613905 RepID=UPI0010FB47D7|nr:uncharacterized protein K02A2.6-like [Nylanderia fulva]